MFWHNTKSFAFLMQSVPIVNYCLTNSVGNLKLEISESKKFTSLEFSLHCGNRDERKIFSFSKLYMENVNMIFCMLGVTKSASKYLAHSLGRIKWKWLALSKDECIDEKKKEKEIVLSNYVCLSLQKEECKMSDRNM